MKKVLFHSPLAYTPHWEIELNLIEKRLREGDEVVLLACRGELPACAQNPHHTFIRCFDCKSRKQAGYDWIGKSRFTVKNFYRITPDQQDRIEKLKSLNVASVEQIKTIEIDGSDIGLAALSSVVSSLREFYVDPQKHADLIKRYLHTAAMTHFSIVNHLEEEKPDEVFLFNGRSAETRPVLRASLQSGADTFIHETARVAGRYLLIKNDIIHSLRVWKKLLDQTFEDSKLGEAEKRKIAEDWFEERRKRDFKNQLIFTGNQEKDLLPEGFSKKVVNIGIFNSSEDEFIGFDEFKNPFYKDQNDGIFHILKSFEGEPNVKFYLRMHPNLAGLDNTQTRFLEQLENQFSNFKLIRPESPIDTYSLIDACDFVITFASTVGIEAVYAGKTCILMGRALYEDLEGVIRPNGHEELVSIIIEYVNTRNLPDAGDREKGYTKYGFFMREGGTQLEFGESQDWWRVKMVRNGEEKFIKPSVVARVFNKTSAWLTSSKMTADKAS